MDRRRKRANYPRCSNTRKKGKCGLKVLLITIFLVTCLGYSVIIGSLHSKSINREFKRVFLGWNECDDYNKRNVTIYIRPYERTTLIEPKDVCPNATKHIKNKLLFLVFVLSAIDHFDLRNYIRKSWGSYDNYKTTERLLADIRLGYKEQDYINYHMVDKEAFQAIEERVNDERIYYKYKDPLFRVVFLLGKPRPDDDWSQKHINEEATEYNDILQEDFVDTYSNLTLKTLMMMKWVLNNCGNRVRYIMKSDDDAYVNMHLMIEKLQYRAEEFDDNDTTVADDKHRAEEFNDNDATEADEKHRAEKFNDNDESTDVDEKEYVLFGFLKDGKDWPNRDKNAKHYAPECYYPNGTRYPSYLAGAPGYVMSLPVAKTLYEASWSTPYLNLEDIYVTGLLPLRSEPRIQIEHEPTFKEDMRTLYSALKTCNFLYRPSIGSVDMTKMKVMHKRSVDIAELKECYLRV